MSKTGSIDMIVSGIGIGAVIIVAGWIGYSFVGKSGDFVCEGRYLQSSKLGLTGDGDLPLSPAEFEARVGVNAWGLYNNSRIVEDKDAPGGHALEVSIAKGTSSGFKEEPPRGGVTFMWSPLDLPDQPAACLTYHVFLPEDLEVGGPGVLPGLFIGRDFDPRGELVTNTGSGTRLAWQRDGQAVVHIQFANNEGWQYAPLTRSDGTWPRGRWVAVDQEIVLNTPGKKDGIVRMWLDGKIVAENKAVAVRSTAAQSIAGVLADVQFGTMSNPFMAPKDTVIRLSPLVVRWQLPSETSE